MKQFISILGIFVLLSFVMANAQQEIIDNENDDSNRIEGYDIIKEKMLPKCLEYEAADAMDYLKNQDTQLWLMCMEFIIDEKKIQ